MSNQNETINPQLAAKAQADYAAKTKSPLFAPTICFKCRTNIYQHISVERAGRELITGCPKCCKSFVD